MTHLSTLSLNTQGRFQLPFSAVMDQAFIEVLVSDARGRVLFVNRSFETFSGLSRQEVVGRSVAVLETCFPNGEYFGRLEQTMASGSSWQGKLACCPREGGVKTYYTTISPIREESSQELVYLSVLRDVTDLEIREKQLQQVGKMEAIGTLAGGIAHDFNNILAGLVGYAELVKEDLELLGGVDPKTHDRLENMISGAMRAKKLIQQILTFSRSGRGVRAPVRAAVMVKEAVELLRASLPSTIGIDLTLDADPLILAEPTQMHQILMNLCTNSRDAMADQGGSMSISLSEVQGGARGRSGLGPAQGDGHRTGDRQEDPAQGHGTVFYHQTP